MVGDYLQNCLRTPPYLGQVYRVHGWDDKCITCSEWAPHTVPLDWPLSVGCHKWSVHRKRVTGVGGGGFDGHEGRQGEEQ